MEGREGPGLSQFPNLSTTDVSDWILLLWGCPVRCGVFPHEMPEAAPPQPLPVLAIQNVSRRCRRSRGGKAIPVKNHWSKPATDSQKAVFSSHLMVPDSGLQHAVESLERWLTTLRGHPLPAVFSQGCKACNLGRAENRISHGTEKEGIAN